MRHVLYSTGLWDRQEYCQRERITAFNGLQEEADKLGITIHVRTTVNNSGQFFAKRLELLHKKFANFDFEVMDIGHKDYKCVSEGEEVYDIYRLMAEIFNADMELATERKYDFFSIQSGDQILPREQVSVFPTFLDVHEDCGLVNGLIYWDYSKTKTQDGRPAYRPMVSMKTPEEQVWMLKNLLPTALHDGMDYCVVHRIGTGGCLIPRRTFTELRFHEEFNGIGEDLRFCDEIRDKLGMKVYIVPWVHIPNRYPNGEFY